MNTLHSRVQAAVVLALLGAAAASVVGCATANDLGTVSDDSELVTFPAASFASATTVTVGQTRTVQAPAHGFGILRFAGDKNEPVTIAVRDDQRYAAPRTYLVERRADGKFAAVLKSPLTASSTLSFRLEATKDYFIVVREENQDAASFAVTLTSNALCGGAPRTFTTAELGKRMVQGSDSLGVDGRFYSTNGALPYRTYLIAAGSTVLDMPGTGARIDLASGTVTADDPALAAESYVEINDNCIGIENSRFSFAGSIPPVASRTSLAPTSKPFACESGATIANEEALVSRIPAGQTSVSVGQASLIWTEWRCSSLTGCIQQSGATAEMVSGVLAVDPSTQELSFSLLHKKDNFATPQEDLPLTNGTFKWGAYVGRVTSKFVVITETRPYSETINGVKRTAEYRAGYCLVW